MSRRDTTRLGILAVLLIGFVLGYGAASSSNEPAKSVKANQDDDAKADEKPVSHESQQPPAISPTKAAANRDVYFPGTEDLKPDEMRITALGTGMPSARPKQAAACFLVELGNGEKFLFDIGSGSHERIAAQKIPYDYLDKVFIGHLHVDHFGDLPTFWLGGTTMNRLGTKWIKA